jgi:hypothetical protein
MLKLKKIRIITLVGIAFVLLIFVILPLIGHAYRTHHFNYPSVIPIKNWKRFSSDEGKFSVLFPGTPEGTNDLIKTSFGEIRMQTFFVWSDIQTEYAVNYNDNPKIVEKLSPNKNLIPVRKVWLKNSGKLLTSEILILEIFQHENLILLLAEKPIFLEGSG